MPVLQQLPDAVEFAGRSDQQAFLSDGWRGHTQLFHRVDPQLLKLPASLNDKAVAIFTQAENLAVVCPRARGETTGLALEPLPAIYLCASLGIVTGDEALVMKYVAKSLVHHRSGHVRGPFTLHPGY